MRTDTVSAPRYPDGADHFRSEGQYELTRGVGLNRGAVVCLLETGRRRDTRDVNDGAPHIGH